MGKPKQDSEIDVPLIGMCISATVFVGCIIGTFCAAYGYEVGAWWATPMFGWSHALAAVSGAWAIGSFAFKYGG